MADIVDKARERLKGIKPAPQDVEERVRRGREKAKGRWTENDLCLKFWRGEQYHYVNSKGYLAAQGTVTDPGGGGKPRHRVRQAHNLIHSIVEGKVSAATRRVPSYEISPATTDPEDIAAARVAEKVALYGYEKWNVRKKTVAVSSYAIVAGEGFAWPFWDSTVGPFIDDGEGGTVGQGEVRIRVYGPNEVYWEPGVEFEDSSWHCVEQARPVDDVKQMEGYVGGELAPDAQASDNPSEEGSGKLVLVKDYLERPSQKHPKGRWLTIAAGKVICPVRAYPCAEYGHDELVLHRLSYTHDPSDDHDRGLVWHLIPPQRTYNDASNKISEWKNLCLNPQVFVTPGVLKQRLNDEPGAVYEVPNPNENIKWRDPAKVPAELFQIMETAEREIRTIAADNDIPSQVESSRAIQAVIERDENRWQAFIADLAEFHSGLMRHCLKLVQQHYTEPRLLKLKGRIGWESVADFQGTDLRGQCDVRVLPGSIEPRTKAALEQRILAFADRGWITPESAMTAINGGTAEKLVEGYELEVAAVNRDIQRLMDIERVSAGEIPIAPFYANPEIRLPVFTQWLTTEEAESAHPVIREAAQLYYEQLEQLRLQKQLQAQAMQTQQAEQYGITNAAKPQTPGKPSMPALQPGQDKLAA